MPGHAYEQGFDLRLVPEALDLPLRWKKARRIFVNSMSDLFHEDVPDSYIEQVFAVAFDGTGNGVARPRPAAVKQAAKPG